ncbi:hypothetical protein DIPPA_11075 [Diplonema papillatum]|nr:hypothetical protein DIPPA_11075 [Diplonema papillatum]
MGGGASKAKREAAAKDRAKRRSYRAERFVKQSPEKDNKEEKAGAYFEVRTTGEGSKLDTIFKEVRRTYNRFLKDDESDDFDIAAACLTTAGVSPYESQLAACVVALRASKGMPLWDEITEAVLVYQRGAVETRVEYVFPEISAPEGITRRSLRRIATCLAAEHVSIVCAKTDAVMSEFAQPGSDVLSKAEFYDSYGRIAARIAWGPNDMNSVKASENEL